MNKTDLYFYYQVIRFKNEKVNFPLALIFASFIDTASWLNRVNSLKLHAIKVNNSEYKTTVSDAGIFELHLQKRMTY
jgi:hypothetical protein